MKQPFQRTTPLVRRLEALVFAAAIVWGVTVTAGSASASAAGQALLDALPLQALQWTLGSVPTTLSPAAAMTIGESPLLLSAQHDMSLLRSHEEETTPPEQTECPDPVVEEPIAAAPQVDNGVPARTLIPRNSSGYTVVGKSYISSTREDTLSAKALETPFSTRLAPEGPQLLIVHTHGSEAYTPADATGIVWSGNHRSTDTRCSVVRVGDAMADVFSKAGISVLHDRTLYDYPNYKGSYDRSLEGINRHLKDHPSIRFVLDIHRDAIEDKAGNQYKVLSDIKGVDSAAQMTLVVGSDGSGLPHANWIENLRLAVALQNATLEQYPTLMRPILLRKSRYNQHVTPGALLVEVGAAGNSPEEAELAGRLLAQKLSELLLHPEES